VSRTVTAGASLAGGTSRPARSCAHWAWGCEFLGASEFADVVQYVEGCSELGWGRPDEHDDPVVEFQSALTYLELCERGVLVEASKFLAVGDSQPDLPPDGLPICWIGGGIVGPERS